MLTGTATGCENWNEHTASPIFSSEEITANDTVTIQQLADEGEILIFGTLGKSDAAGYVGKAQCPVCHAFQPKHRSKRAPNLWGISTRQRTKTTSIEYLAESHVCPTCYVVAGWGLKGSRDCESPMPKAHLPPVNLTLNELVAIDTWLYVHEGEAPPAPQVIRSAYQHLLSPEEWSYVNRDSHSTQDAETSVKRLFLQHACAGCHIIPNISAATGRLGPQLQMKTNAPARLEDPAYTGHASSPSEYIMESILFHDVYIVADNPMYAQTTPSSSYYDNTIGSVDLNQMVAYLESAESDEQPESPDITAIEECLHNTDS
ncbi:MAG: hypothetical protein NPIRA02_15650 [Nitrospirales bacterium]|nr:MAG: hypothetical protein NPIRA02_15650 [Nitrospirales bacterium]